MRTPIALSNLLHGKWRTLVSTSGVALAIVLVFMQLGFLGAVAATATQIYDRLEFDVLLRSPDYFHFCDPREIPRRYLYLCEAMPQVESVRPLHVVLATWRIPRTDQTVKKKTAGELRGIVAMGIDPTQNVFSLPDFEQKASLLTSAGALLIDRKTKGNDYGALDGKKFNDADIDRSVEVWDKRFRIIGLFELGAGLAANGSVIVSESGYARFYPGDITNVVNYGLIRLKNDVDAEQFRDHLVASWSNAPSGKAESRGLECPISVMTREEVRRYEIKRWLLQTPIGAIFFAGVIVALVVGSVVVYMVLSNDVANHLKEYATLKAMGYTHGFLSRIVMQQAVSMAVLGYAAALLISEVLYRFVGNLANLPMEMTWLIRISVLAMSIGMCCVSGIATLRKLHKAEPADLF